AAAAELAERLVAGVAAEAFPGEPPLSVSVSLGTATFPDDGTDAAALMESADRRNYLAKRSGRARAVTSDQAAPTGPAEPVAIRLLERDQELVAAQDFLSRLQVARRGLFRVDG